jgi:hypothetical protein
VLEEKTNKNLWTVMPTSSLPAPNPRPHNNHMARTSCCLVLIAVCSPKGKAEGRMRLRAAAPAAAAAAAAASAAATSLPPHTSDPCRTSSHAVDENTPHGSSPKTCWRKRRSK